MRHSFSAWIALAGALCLASCARETVEVRERFSYESTILVDCGETRTANTGSGTTWVADDAISAIHTDASDPNFYASRFYYSGEGNAFRGSVTDAAEYNDWYLVYPYREDNTDASQIHVTVENTAEQVGNDDRTHLAGEGFPLVGKKTQVEGRDIRMSMGQVLTILQIKVVNDRFDPIVVKEITVAVPHEIAGHFVGDLTPESVEKTKDIAWTAEGNNSKNLTLTVKDGEEILNQDAMFYIGAMPFTLKAGESIKVKITAVDKATNNELTFYKTFKRDVDMDFPAGEMSQQLKNSFDYDPEDYQDPDPEGPVVKENQTLTFANASLTLTLGDVYAVGGTYDFPQTVEGAKTPVTYTSLNTDVITIVDNSKIHIVKAGTATIKASAIEDDTYNAAEATYTLTVTEAAVAPSQRTYTYVAPGSLTEGTYVITGSETNELSAALFPTVSTKSWSSQTTGSVSNGQYIPHKVIGSSNSVNSFTTEDADIIAGEVEMVKNGSNWRIKVKSTGEYLAAPSQEYRISFGTESAAANFAISSGTSGASVQAGSYYFYHSGSAGGFTLRTSSTANTRFYKLDASKNTQNISFSSNQFTYTLGDTYYVGGTYNLPQVSGAATTVTYSTTNTDVLTISGTTYTILKAGTATITASAAETASYYGATATTTITINPASVTPVTSSAYVKVTAEPSSWDGTYLFVDENSSKAFAAFSANSSSYAVNVTINNGQIAATSDNAKYALTVADAGVKHANASSLEAYNIKNSDGKYIFWSSSTLQILDSNEKTAGGGSSSTLYTYYNTLAYSNGGVQVMSSGHSSGFGKYYLGYANNAFNYASDSESRRVQLYKLGESTTPGKLSRNLQFAQTSVTVSQATGTTLQVQALTGEKNGVEYSSTNSNVATVNGTTITIQGYGSTTIIAQAPENDVYAAGTASYTLIVNNPSAPTTNAYVKVTSEPSSWEGTYLFVDENSSKAFAAVSNNPTGYAVNVSISGGQIAATSEIAKYALTIVDTGARHGNTAASGQEAYNVKNSDGMYVYASQSAVQISSSNSRTSGSNTYTYYHAFKYDGGVQVLSANNQSSGTVYYLGYSSNAFGYSSSNASGRRVQLYKLQSSGGSSDPGKLNQTLSFAQSTVNLTMATAGGTQAVQTVSGAQTSVTYSSSNANVATVDGTTITIKGFGTTVITATAAESSTYNSASAAYTLNVQQSGSSSGSTRTYTYQTSASAGTYLLGGYESSGSQYSIALFPTVQTGNWNSSQGNVTNGQYLAQRDITSDNTISFTNDDEIFNAEVELIASGNNWKIKVISTGKYLAVPSQDNRIVYADTESAATAFSISSSAGSGYGMGGGSSNTVSVSSGSYYFYHSSSAHGFSMRAYQVTNIRLYKKTSEGSSSGKQNQTLSFAQSSVTQSMATASGTMSVQQVSGAQTSVTYSSSNSNVATVSGTTITIRGFGSTTITATAAESNSYNSASASYTLTISQSGGGSSSGERTYTYTAPNDLVEGTYLIAGSETNELSIARFPNVSTGSWNSQQTGQVNNGQYIPHKVVGSNNSVSSITSTDSDVIASEVELVKNNNNWRILVKSNSQYLASPSQEYRISFTSTASSAANFTISSGTNGATIQTGSYYFYHSGSAGGFTLRTSSTANVRFYRLTSGGGTSGKQYQSLSFDNSTETLALESASGQRQVQQVRGAQTSVSYSSSNTSVATVSGTTLTITGFGSTTITANAVANDNYYSASASYTLTVKRASQTGVYNLENEAIEDYLDRAINGSTGNKYTFDNHSSLSYVSSILSAHGNPSASNRIDWPAPVTVTWTQSVSTSNATLAVYYDQAHTSEEVMAVPQISSTTADIYNLIPGKTYYWVLKNGNSTVASGSFDTEGRRRMVGIGQKSNYGQNYANNCRDLGGQVTTSGKTLKYGRMYRGSNMDNTTSDQKKYLLEKMKIRLDVDLRTSGYGGNGNSLNNALGNNSSGVTMSNITVGDYNTYVGHTQEEYSGGSDLTNRNKMGPTLMRIMNAIHNGVNVYIHCMVGADRTGGTCLYLESLLGVPPERCDMDFEMTSFSCVGSRTRNGSSPEQFYTVYRAINNATGSTWQEKAINYCVNTLGVNRDMITQFQNDMLE